MKRSAYRRIVALAILAFAALPVTAKAEECLQVGWKMPSGAWNYYRAHVVSEGGGRTNINYDYHHGKLELKAFDKERSSGELVIVMRGNWFEGDDARHSGKIRVEMKKGTHHANGWYTNGDDAKGQKFSIVLRDCPVKG